MNWRTTVVLAAVFAAAVVVWALWRPEPSPEGPPQSLFPDPADQYTKIEIHPLGQPTIILERRPEPVAGLVWQLTQPLQWLAWEPYVMEMLSGLRELTDWNVVRPGAPDHDLKRAGVEEPELVVHLTLQQGRKTIKWGRLLARDPSQQWFILDGDPRLFFGPKDARENFRREVKELRHKGIVFFERHRVVRIELHEFVKKGIVKDGGMAVTEGYEISEFRALENASGFRGWYLTKHQGRDLEERVNEVRINQLLGELASLTAEDFVALGEPAKHGLDKPETRYRLWLRGSEQPIGVLFGRTEKLGGKDVTYMHIEGSSEVALVDAARLHATPRARSDFRSREVYDFAGEEIDWVDIASDLKDPSGQPYRVRIARSQKEGPQGREDVWTVQHPLGLKIDAEDLQDFVNLLFRLQINEKGFFGKQEDPKICGFDRPVTMTVMLHRKNGQEQQQVYQFGSKADLTYMMKPGSDEVFGVPDPVYAKLDRLELNFRDRAMLNVEPKSVQKIVVDIEDEVLLTRSYYSVEKQGGEWRFGDSVHVGKEIDAEKMKVVVALANYIRAEQFLSRRPEVAKEKGLDTNNTAGRVEIAYADDKGERRKAVLKISKPFRVAGNAEKERFAMIGEERPGEPPVFDPIVFRLSGAFVDRLNAGVEKK